MSNVHELELQLAEARRAEVEQAKQAAQAAKEAERRRRDFQKVQEGQVAALERRLVDAEKMTGGPAEYDMRCDARSWLRGHVDGNGYKIDPRVVTSRDEVAAQGFDIAATATSLIEVWTKGLQGVTLDYGSEVVRRADEVERGAWRVFARRMRAIACED